MELVLETEKNYCPNCGEVVELVIDCSADEQTYQEDCQVCCQPMNVSVSLDPEGQPKVSIKGINE